MTDRSVCALGCILGGIAKNFGEDSEEILANARINPMCEITAMHLKYINMPKQLKEYIGNMFEQIDGSELEDVTADIKPSQQNILTIGFNNGYNTIIQMNDTNIEP